MIPLSNVLVELRLAVHHKVQIAPCEWLFLIARITCSSMGMPADEDCAYIYSGVEDDPYIYEEEADALRRHFKPPRSNSFITTLGLR
jgi:hypothetical protein